MVLVRALPNRIACTAFRGMYVAFELGFQNVWRSGEDGVLFGPIRSYSYSTTALHRVANCEFHMLLMGAEASWSTRRPRPVEDSDIKVADHEKKPWNRGFAHFRFRSRIRMWQGLPDGIEPSITPSPVASR